MASDEFRSDIVSLLPKLRRFAVALTGTRHDADDLVQSAIERALARSEQWSPGTRLDSWMYRIVQNLWIDETRGRRVRGESVPLDLALESPGEDGRATTERRLMMLEVREAFAALSADLRAAAALVILNGLSYSEAASALGVPIGTIMSRVSRSRRAIVERMGAEPPAHAERAP